MMDLRKLVISGVVASTLALGSVTTYAASFDDVSGLDSEMSITKLVSLGYFVNKGSEFHPENGLTRLEYADLAAKLVGLGKPKVVKIKDTKNSNANKLVSRGYLNLTKKGEFLPKKGVTYAEFSKLLASGLGFKTSWTNRPVDFLFFLDRKGVLDISTNLDAVVTKEEAAVAVDKYLEVKNAYRDVEGVIQGSSPTSVTLKSSDGVRTYSISKTASLFINDDETDTDSLGLGTEARLIFDKSGKVAFVDAIGLDSAEGSLNYSSGLITVGTKSYNVNLNLITPSLPTSPDSDFTFKDFTGYAAAGVSFKGSVYTNLDTDYVTALNAYITSVDERAVSVSATGLVTFDFSEDALNNLTFTPDASTKVTATVDGKTSDSSVAGLFGLQAQGYKLKGKLTAGEDGAVTTLDVVASK